MNFVDIDRIIEKIYNEKHTANLTVRQIYETIGATEFRSLEQTAIMTLTEVSNSVIATGGGSMLAKANVLELKKIGKLIYLKVGKDTLKERLLSAQPAFLDPTNFATTFNKMYLERKEIYREIADIVIYTDSKNIETIAQEIIEEINHG
jgi:shikimate kinase